MSSNYAAPSGPMPDDGYVTRRMFVLERPAKAQARIGKRKNVGQTFAQFNFQARFILA
jgi:hypothetical protein